ncbi:hypothetical protein RHMOL_Rhmol11G0070600 [Rhododendron molle]|uniref:Uncharacterized protein n=1 Tax=Rhododendron molle TaxID=49168 RepID=A0ACC0LQG9_RHOML|nr:hypothetical protein RHMOL_Rhmol11G0070600 [Rhododendron molle]
MNRGGLNNVCHSPCPGTSLQCYGTGRHFHAHSPARGKGQHSLSLFISGLDWAGLDHNQSTTLTVVYTIEHILEPCVGNEDLNIRVILMDWVGTHQVQLNTSNRRNHWQPRGYKPRRGAIAKQEAFRVEKGKGKPNLKAQVDSSPPAAPYGYKPEGRDGMGRRGGKKV